MSKKEKAQIGVVLCSVLLIIISIVGDTYAYFTADIKKENVTPTVITTGIMRIEYTNSEEITGEKLLPGWVSEAKTFTVKNTGTLPVDYDINITNVTNTFTKPAELVYKLTRNGTTVIEEQRFPIMAETILTKVTIHPEETHTYTLQVTFKELGTAQDYNQGKGFRGKIEVGENTEPFAENAVTTLTELAKTNTTEMFTDDTDDANIRYMGANPNNYVDIGNGNDADGNPILWRIIGIMNNVDDGTGNKETRLKIIRENSIGSLAWDSSSKNNWETASLNTILNGDYYNKQGEYLAAGIGDNNLIQDAVYYLGGTTNVSTDTEYYYQTATTKDLYRIERSTKVYTFGPTTNPATWTGKVGLMYPSDYGYATSGGSVTNKTACAAKELYKWYSSSVKDCKNNDWLLDSTSGQWTISPSVDYNFTTTYIDNTGYIEALSNVDSSSRVRPVVYLKADAKILGGIGTKENPYKLG